MLSQNQKFHPVHLYFYHFLVFYEYVKFEETMELVDGCSQRSNLQSHKRATHYDDKRYKCMECGKAFKRRRLLDYHMKAAHTGERPFKCNVCAATFIYPEHFKKHRRIHTGEKPYSCEVRNVLDRSRYLCIWMGNKASK